MKKIYKYTLHPDENKPYEMPKNAIVLCTMEQFGDICIWAEIETDEKETEIRHFGVFGTGHQLTFNCGAYIGSVKLQNGALIFHIYEILDNKKAKTNE